MRNDIRIKIVKLEKKIDQLEKQLSTSQTLGLRKQNQGKKIIKLESLHGDRFIRKSNFRSKTIDYVPFNLRPLVN